MAAVTTPGANPVKGGKLDVTSLIITILVSLVVTLVISAVVKQRIELKDKQGRVIGLGEIKTSIAGTEKNAA